MKNLIKADFKKIFYLPGNRSFLLSTICLSILLGMIFLFTTNVTQGRALIELSSMEVIDITLLGMDVAAIMLLIFTANFIKKDLTSGAVHTNLAITPVRGNYFLSKVSFISILAILLSIVLILLFFAIDQLVLSMNGMGGLSIFALNIFTKIVGSIVMVLFYSLLSASGTFYLQSAFRGAAFALSVMFLPALIKMFPADISDILLPIFPEDALSALIDVHSADGSLLRAILVLLLWIIVSSLIGQWKFKKMDY